MAILVIDGDPEDQILFEKALRDGGYSELTFVPTAEQALEFLGVHGAAATTAAFDTELVILSLPTMEESVDICRRIKESFHFQDIPVIVAHGGAPSDAMPMAVAYGAHDYVRKPYVPFEFLARVRAAMRLKHETDRRKARERELLEATRQLADLNAMLTRLSLVDSLTGIANRRNFDRALENEWRRAFRSKSDLGLILIDVDFFKQYNDAYGHQGGDECLRHVVNTLKAILRRPGDLLCRYGGEEFVVLLPETPVEGVVTVAENLRVAVERANIPHGHSKVGPQVTVSLGVASIRPHEGGNPKDIVELADRALYQSKRGGRNRVTFLTRPAVVSRAAG